MLTLTSNKSGESISPLNNPFSAKYVKAIRLHGYPEVSSINWRGSIEFQNGDTEGTQKFETYDLVEITQKMDTFIKSLNTK